MSQLIDKIKSTMEEKHMARMQKLGRVLMQVLDDIRPAFRPEVRLTIIARYPGRPDNDIVIGSDQDFDELEKLMQRTKERYVEARTAQAGLAQQLPPGTLTSGYAQVIKEIEMENTVTDPNETPAACCNDKVPCEATNAEPCATETTQSQEITPAEDCAGEKCDAA